MLSLFDPIRGLDYLSLLLKLVTASLCGGAIGMERLLKNRRAGIRTHILVSLGGAVAAVTGHFLYLELGLPADVTRISGQVITGLGFIGAGTILVTKDLSIKGLTTAAGIWVSGIVGIAVGSGFYEGGLLVTILLLITQTVIARMDPAIRAGEKTVPSVQYSDHAALEQIVKRCREDRMAIRDVRVCRTPDLKTELSAMITLQGDAPTSEQIERLRRLPGVAGLECAKTHF